MATNRTAAIRYSVMAGTLRWGATRGLRDAGDYRRILRDTGTPGTAAGRGCLIVIVIVCA